MNSTHSHARTADEKRLLAPVEEAGSRLEQIRTKALELYAEKGFAQVGMRELALHLGIGAGSIYNHFGSKEQLLFEVIEDLYEDLLESAVRTETAADDRLQAVLHAHIDMYEQRPLGFLLGEQEFRCLSPSHQEHIRQMRTRYEEILLRRLIDAGACAALPVLRATVRGVVAWLNNLSTWVDQDELNPPQRREVIDGVINGALSAAFQPAVRVA